MAEFLVILGHFLTFTLLYNLKNQNFEKMKKNLEYIIILHLDIPNGDHMMYGSGEMERCRQNLLLFWTIRKIKILKKMKKMPVDVMILHMCTINENHIMYIFHEICSMTTFFSHFEPFFALSLL